MLQLSERRYLVGVDNDGLARIAALLRADGERIDDRLHVCVLRIQQQPRIALRMDNDAHKC